MIQSNKDLKIDTLTRPVMGELHHAHCSGIVSWSDGELLAVFYWGITEAHHDQKIFAVRKKPDSDRWSDPFVIADDRFRMMGNPAIWIAPDTHKLFLFFVRSWGGWAVCNPRFKTSTDRGHTWSKDKPIYRFISRGIKNPPIMTSKGTYILPAYVEFVDYYSVFYRSEDTGKHWKDCGARVKIKDNEVPEEILLKLKRPWGKLVLQPTLIERMDGSLIALMRAKRPLGKMYYTESFDDGKSWSNAKPYILPNPGGGFHWLRLQSGSIAIIYNHAPVLPDHGFERNPLSVALSEDDGKSWTYRRNIMEAKGDDVHLRIGGYPTLTQQEDGTIHATWTYNYRGEYQGQKTGLSDIKYTSFTEEWIKQKTFFNDVWE
ncbi:MAG: hypothetical protein GF364_01810 [Candidatus Lokiarchaeota archaeon]|nr:hypothetical protein [Candidatus Lokiarchaeota archaeon]